MKYVFITEMSIDQCLVKLQQSINGVSKISLLFFNNPTSWFDKSIDLSEKPLIGSVNGNRFNLRKGKKITWFRRRSTWMVFKGKFEQKEYRTLITGRFDLSLGAKIVATVFTTPVLFLILIILFNSFSKGTEIDVRGVMLMLIFPFGFLTSIFLAYRMEELDQPQIIDFIKVTFKATQVAPERKQN